MLCQFIRAVKYKCMTPLSFCNSMDDASSEQTVVPLDLLREITDGFSEERKLGSGSYGKVYLVRLIMYIWLLHINNIIQWYNSRCMLILSMYNNIISVVQSLLGQVSLSTNNRNNRSTKSAAGSVEHFFFFWKRRFS